MKEARILLLDMDPASGLGSTLRKILESSLNLGITLRHESVTVFQPTLADSDLSTIISRFNPDLLFLVLSPSQLKQVGVLFQSMSREYSELPIIAVIEECQPDQMLALLKLGAADFITPPLKAIDVLPRLWRLLEQTRRSEILTHRLKEKLGLNQFVGESAAFLAVVRKIPLVAKCDATILISP